MVSIHESAVQPRPRHAAAWWSRLSVLGFALVFSGGSAVASETKSFVISWFDVAQYYDAQGKDCPQGLNPNSRGIFRRELSRLGYKPGEIEPMIADFLSSKNMQILVNRGRIDGKPVDAYAHPTSVPDPNLKLVEGRYGFGFNLDGKISARDFEDPNTGEKGIDNQLYRVIGCHNQLRKNIAGERPMIAVAYWETLFEQIPAWVIEISGIDDPQNDEHVTVGVYRAVEPKRRTATNQTQSYMTFRIDPDSRSQNVVTGRIKDGVITTDPSGMTLIGDPLWVQEFVWHQARLRLQIRPDGNLAGLLGGYQSWFSIYWQQGSHGWGLESQSNIDIPGFYYSLAKTADAEPDPKTGQNTAISSAYELEGVPAYLVHPTNNLGARADAAGPRK